MSKLITRTLLWLFTRSMYYVEIGIPVQALIPQATEVTVASVTAKYPWSSFSFAAFCGCKSITNEIRPAWRYIKARYLTSHSRKQWASKTECCFQGMFSKPPVTCSLNLETCIVSAWKENSVDFSSDMFCSYFLNSHKLLTSPASCGNEFHSFNCILFEAFFFLCFLKSVIC